LRIHRWFWVTLIAICLTMAAAYLIAAALIKYGPNRPSSRARLVRLLPAHKVDRIYMMDR